MPCPANRTARQKAPAYCGMMVGCRSAAHCSLYQQCELTGCIGAQAAQVPHAAGRRGVPRRIARVRGKFVPPQRRRHDLATPEGTFLACQCCLCLWFFLQPCVTYTHDLELFDAAGTGQKLNHELSGYPCNAETRKATYHALGAERDRHRDAREVAVVLVEEAAACGVPHH